MRHPLVTGGTAIAALLLLAVPVRDVDLGLNTGATTIANHDAGRGLAVLESRFTSGALSPITVVAASDTHLTDGQLAAIVAFVDELGEDPEVAAASSIIDVLRGHQLPLTANALDQLAITSAPELISRQRDATIVTVTPTHQVDSAAARALVERIRRDLSEPARNAGLTVGVTGQTAGIVDLAHEVAGEVPWVFAYVLGISFVLLLVVFRSPLLALKAIVMNLLSVAAAYGALVWVFQQGHGAQVFGFTSDGTIQAWLPIVAFAILFGISMDYEVFLIGRMREEWDRVGDNEAAVRAGLSHTAKPITSAAAIQVAVFGAFVFTKVPEVQQLGFVLTVAIALDATLIRTVLVPATMRVLGAANWWAPRWLPVLRTHPPNVDRAARRAIRVGVD